MIKPLLLYFSLLERDSVAWKDDPELAVIVQKGVQLITDASISKTALPHDELMKCMIASRAEAEDGMALSILSKAYVVLEMHGLAGPSPESEYSYARLMPFLGNAGEKP